MEKAETGVDTPNKAHPGGEKTPGEKSTGDTPSANGKPPQRPEQSDQQKQDMPKPQTQEKAVVAEKLAMWQQDFAEDRITQHEFEDRVGQLLKENGSDEGLYLTPRERERTRYLAMHNDQDFQGYQRPDEIPEDPSIQKEMSGTFMENAELDEEGK